MRNKFAQLIVLVSEVFLQKIQLYDLICLNLKLYLLVYMQYRTNHLLQLNDVRNLIEHLYFIHLFNLIELKELNNKLGYSIDEWKELEKINKLRNIIAHPIQSLLNKVNDIKSLYDTLSKIEDLTFRINQLSKIKS